MDLRDLVRAILAYDSIGARQWIADAERAHLDWSSVRFPEGLDPTEEALAAGVAELLARRAGATCPSWTSRVKSAPAPVYLLRSALTMPRLRKACEEDGPEPLRRRLLFAPPEFLTIA